MTDGADKCTISKEMLANLLLVCTQNAAEEDSDSDGDEGVGESGKRGIKRRLSSTTEATRRTSIEDDDDEEVVHVKMDIGGPVSASGAGVGLSTNTNPGNVGAGIGIGSKTAVEDDGELIEIQHEEMQGVETGGGAGVNK